MTYYQLLLQESSALGLDSHGMKKYNLLKQVQVARKEAGKELLMNETEFNQQQALADIAAANADPEPIGVILESVETPKVEVPVEAPKVEVPVEAPIKKIERKFNEIIVLDGKREIRRFSLTIHGESFSKLANQFAKKHDYAIEAHLSGSEVQCPGCGHLFAPRY